MSYECNWGSSLCDHRETRHGSVWSLTTSNWWILVSTLHSKRQQTIGIVTLQQSVLRKKRGNTCESNPSVRKDNCGHTKMSICQPLEYTRFLQSRWAADAGCQVRDVGFRHLQWHFTTCTNWEMSLFLVISICISSVHKHVTTASMVSASKVSETIYILCTGIKALEANLYRNCCTCKKLIRRSEMPESAGRLPEDCNTQSHYYFVIISQPDCQQQNIEVY